MGPTFTPAAGLVALALVAGGCGGEPAGPPEARNVILVVTDDQTVDAISKMPWLDSRRDWTRFERAYINQPWCCPSRASILSGQWAHHHGVIGNSRFAKEFDDSETIVTRLDDAGYETGLFGKYLNGFPWDRGDDYVPPGWDRWTAFLNTNGAYYDYELGIDGAESVRHGEEAADHSTALFGRRAVAFVRDAPEPFFAMLTPYAPHEPATPAPRDLGAFAEEPVERPPNFGVVAPDQPEHVRERGRLPFARAAAAKRRAWASTLAVDRILRDLFAAVRERGVLGNTVFVFISDNGFAFGSHRLRAKNCLYQECAQVPMLMWTPGVDGGEVATPFSNVDLAPTIAGLAGAEPPDDADGEDLSPQLLGDAPWPEDRDLLLEVHQSKQGVPDGYALVNSRWKYIEHATGEVELYDLRSDPYELDNLAGEPALAERERELADRLAELVPGA